MSAFKAPPRTQSANLPTTSSKSPAPPPAFLNRVSEPAPAPQAQRASPPPAQPAVPRMREPSMSPPPERPHTPDGVQAGRFYPVTALKRICEQMDNDQYLPGRMREFCAKLWPEGTSRPDTLWSREGLFSDKERTVKDRKLSQMVLGILARITPENYDVMKEKLVELPVRQSTDEEVTDVVKMMYTKAVRPEDELYTELYARLMADLVQHTGVHGVGKTIRKAIIDKCQQQFEKPYALTDEELVDEDGNDLKPEEIDFKKGQLKEKLRANIKFLGHLFLSGMVNEKVVNYVLFHLLYGKDSGATNRPKRKPEEYELEMFCDLLKKVVNNLSPKTLQEYIPGYISSLKNLLGKVSNRLRFMLMAVVELSENGWVDNRRRTMPSGPMRLDEFEKRQQEAQLREQREIEQMLQNQKHGVKNTPSATPKTPLVRDPLPPKEHVYDAVEQYKAEGVGAPLEAFFKPLPPKERAPYLQHWIFRVLKVAKKEDERKKVGEVCEVLVHTGLITSTDVERILTDLATRIVMEELWEETPKMFVHWAEVVYSSKKSYLPVTLHTVLLNKMIAGGERRPPLRDIVKMITNVAEAADPHEAHRDTLRRFRILPAVLSYSKPVHDGESDEETYSDDEEDGDDDLLATLIKDNFKDPELHLFYFLCDGSSAKEVQEYISRSPARTSAIFMCKAMSAVFTYLRCDPTNTQFERLKDAIKLIAKNNEPAVLTEAYLTWRELGRQPSNAYQRFCDNMKAYDIIKKEHSDTARLQAVKVDSTARNEWPKF